MDISRYKFYVRDIGINDNDLQLVLEDVIKDIAISTRIFKKAVGFTIEPNLELYNFKALLYVNEGTQEVTLNDLMIGSSSVRELEQCLNGLKICDTNVTKDTSIGIKQNDYIDLVDIIEYDNNIVRSIIKDFDYIDNANYRYKYYDKLKCDKYATFLCTIIPRLENIDDEVEDIIKSTVIKGLRYFTDTTQNMQNVNPVNLKYQEYLNAKLELQNKFPTIVGYQTKGAFL
jgi:hypothetical protein